MIQIHRLVVFAVLTLVCALAPAARAGEVQVTLKGRKFTTAQVPNDLTQAQKSAIGLFAEWAGAHEYRMDFDAQGRLMLLLPKDSPRVKPCLEVIGKTQTWFESVLPAPERPSAPRKPEAGPPRKTNTAPIPDDPEGRAACYFQDGPPPGTPATPVFAWGTGSIEPDTQTAVMIVLSNEKEYASLLTEVGRTQSYLKSWMEIARKHLGFVIEEPLLGAYVESAAGQEEWNPDHELVNRVAQLMTLRRFGQQPNWLVQGIAWEAEIAYDGALYCFPFRSEFVFVTEHTGWPTQLKLDLKDRAGKAIELSEVTTWKRNTWDAQSARFSWGLVHQLMQIAPGKLSAALEEMRRYRDEKNRRATGPASWERIPEWEVPGETQAATLKTHFGNDALDKATAGMRTGKDAKATKPAAGEKNDKGEKHEKNGERSHG